MKLLLLPGMHGTVDLFAEFEAALPNEFAKQAIGFPNDISLSYAQLIDLVRSRVPSESYVIIAESFSTPLAIQFAATNPPNLKGLVLSAGFATSPVRGLLQFLAPFLAPLLAHVPVNRLGARLMLSGSTAPESLKARIRAAIASVRPKVLMDRVRAVVACNALDELCRITVPILYLRARYDRLVNPVCVEEIRRAKPETGVVVLGSSHMLLQQMPRETARLVTNFVRRL
ncbi:MAG: alpha/beta fold hydrolase [Acidobacteriaceae bacterium]